LKKNELDNGISVGLCDLSLSPFQFRISLTVPKSWPNYGTAYGQTGTTGNLAAFIHRDTGLCVDVIDPANKNSQGLTLRDCNDVYNYGYTWQLFAPSNLTCIFQGPSVVPPGNQYQSMQYDPTKPNNIGTLSTGCPIVKSADVPSWSKTPSIANPDQSIYTYTTLSPQQIVYIGYAGGAEQTFIPKNIIETVAFFYQYNGMSLTYDAITNTLKTQPFARWELYYGNNQPTDPIINNKIFNSQTASFLTYNFIYGSSYATPF
jgi:hypothetical protein